MSQHCHDSLNSMHVHVDVSAAAGMAAGKVHLLENIIDKLCTNYFRGLFEVGFPASSRSKMTGLECAHKMSCCS